MRIKRINYNYHEKNQHVIENQRNTSKMDKVHFTPVCVSPAYTNLKNKYVLIINESKKCFIQRRTRKISR